MAAYYSSCPERGATCHSALSHPQSAIVRTWLVVEPPICEGQLTFDHTTKLLDLRYGSPYVAITYFRMALRRVR